MTDRQTLLLSSFLATENLLKTTTATAGIAGLPPRLVRLSANTAEINEQATLQLHTVEVPVAHVDHVLTALGDSALTLAGIIRAHAAAARLPDLAREVELAPGSFDRLRKNHRPLVAQKVHDTAERVLADLAPYGVTAATLTDFQARIEAAHEAVTKPRARIAARRNATVRLAELFRETTALLDDEIDSLLFPLRASNPSFYAEYTSTRHVARTRREPEALPAPAAAAPAPTPTIETKLAA